jgi:hypothetical protein
MNCWTRRPAWRWFALCGLLAILASTFGCAGGEDVTPEALARAKALWKQAGIQSYDLEWTVTGANNAHYYVTVQGDDVVKVDSIQPDGRRIKAGTNAPRFYSVDGLFLTIAEELALLKTERPFNQPPGTRVVMRFKPDPKLGYPLWYRRDVMGSPQAMRIDVLKLVPKPHDVK